jgi:hypothetical protein
VLSTLRTALIPRDGLVQFLITAQHWFKVKPFTTLPLQHLYQNAWSQNIVKMGKDPSTTRGVSHCGLAIYIKEYIKAKEELRKLKYFTMQKYT